MIIYKSLTPAKYSNNSAHKKSSDQIYFNTYFLYQIIKTETKRQLEKKLKKIQQE